MATETTTQFGSAQMGGFMSGTMTNLLSDTDRTISLQEPSGKLAVEQENLKYSSLVSHIEERYTRAKQARYFDERRWLEAYRNYRGLYGPDVSFTSTERSRAFIKITTQKVNAAYSQLTEIFFANNKFPIMVQPTPMPLGIEENVYFDPQDPENQQGAGGPQGASQGAPQTTGTIARPDILEALGPVTELLEPVKDKLKSGTSGSPTAQHWEPAQIAAELMNKKIQDQLEESNANKELRSTTFEMCLLGTGVFKGPIAQDKEYPKWDESGQYTPKSELIAGVAHVSLWNAYPDPEARKAEEMEYFIQRHRLSKSQMRALKKRPFFRPESIDLAISQGPNYIEEYWEFTLRDSKNEAPNERYEVLEFWGIVDSDLEDLTGLERPKEFEGLDEVQINAWICNGQILRLVYNPYTPVRIPYYICPYELNPYSIFGVGVAENMADMQLLMNGTARMMIDNAILSSNIIFEINENSLVPGQDFELYPGKVFKTNGTPGQNIFANKFPNVTQECMLVFDKFRQLADEATGIPSFSHGMSGIMSTGRTASGMSMLMGAAKENIKPIVRNADDYLFGPLGKSFFAFNMQFNFNEKFIGDLEVIALGTESLMRNEIRGQKLLQLLQLTANPMDAPFIKRDYILRELAKTMDLEADKVVNDPRAALLQAEAMKALMIAQGIPPEAMAGGGVTGGGAPGASDPTGTGGGNIAPGASPEPGAAGFSGGGGGMNSMPKSKQERGQG